MSEAEAVGRLRARLALQLPSLQSIGTELQQFIPGLHQVLGASFREADLSTARSPWTPAWWLAAS